MKFKTVLVLAGLGLAALGTDALAASGGGFAPTETTAAAPDGTAGAAATRAMTIVAAPEAPAEADDSQATDEPTGPIPDLPGSAKPGDEEVPVVEYDVDKLPAPVKRLREQIIAAAATGDPEKLRAIFDANGGPPQLSFDDTGDPIEFLKSLSGDEGGDEILAILTEVLEAGYVHVDTGTPDEVYLWPYFARYPVDKLTPPQLVELFKLVYAGDYEDMKAYGSYSYYRLGIAPNGVWKFFIAGD
jgi:hypothetical protein